MTVFSKILMVSFHFPPIVGSSGYLRVLKYAKYLPDFDWTPLILTVKSSAYDDFSDRNLDLLSVLRAGKVYRSFCLNASKNLSFGGKYPSLFSFPDKWSSWILTGYLHGLSVCRTNNPDVIWCTYPIVSAMQIGLLLHKTTGIPLVADFRDPMWEEETWSDTPKQRYLKRLESKVLEAAKQVHFTSPGTLLKYSNRYKRAHDQKFSLIYNGFDEDDFCNLISTQVKAEKTTFLHSGILSRYERDPTSFFLAIKRLAEEKILDPNIHQFVFRGSGHDYLSEIQRLGISSLISFKPSISYKEALAEQNAADVLMVFQASTCNWQTPAKLFEYMRLNKPTLIFADSKGDTCLVADKAGLDKSFFANLDDAKQIEKVIVNSLKTLNDKKQTMYFPNLNQFNRKECTHIFANKIRLLSST